MELQLRALVKKSLQEYFQPIRIVRCFQKADLKMQKANFGIFLKLFITEEAQKY